MERDQHIIEKLRMMDEDYDGLKPYVKNYLDRIECIIEEQEKLRDNAIDILSSNELTCSALAKTLDCSRTTLYNHNQILKKYIEYSVACYNEKNPLQEIDENRKKRAILEQKVYCMESRDIRNEQLKHDCKTLTAMLKEKNQEIQRLHQRVMELTSEQQKNRNKYL